MPNAITANGIEVKTQEELLTEITAKMKVIYGDDINLASDTPDGQQIMIFIQQINDLLDLIKQAFNSFDPDNAFGKVLDQRVALNGIQRKGGSYTITNVTLTVTQALNIMGLDGVVQERNAYTVQDNAGTKFYLMENQVFAGPETRVCSFRAAEPGETLTVPNTITVPVTIVPGIESVNNPTTYTTLGTNEESDFKLKIRRQKSVSLASQGYKNGLEAALENIDGVVAARVIENKGDDTDADGTPGHCIWVIVDGIAPDFDVADAIYRKRNGGANMRGLKSYVITQRDGSPFIINWDSVDTEEYWIKFDATSLDGISPINAVLLKEKLVELFTFGPNVKININDLATMVQEIDDNCLVTNAGFSKTELGTYTPTLSPTSKKDKLVCSIPKILITVV